MKCTNPHCSNEIISSRKSQQYCSKQCSNKCVKRRKKKLKKCDYKLCSNNVSYYRNCYCESCKKLGRHLMRKFGGKLLSELSIKEYCSRTGANKFDNIRSRARASIKDIENTKCQHCEWDHHVEVCHIKPICEFPETALISEVNEPSNIILLCPNCHWLFDNTKLLDYLK